MLLGSSYYDIRIFILCLYEMYLYCICLISPEPKHNFLNRFFLLKTDIHIKILNIEPFLCKFRGLRYLQNKMWFRDKQVHFLTDLKWFSQHQSGLARA